MTHFNKARDARLSSTCPNCRADTSEKYRPFCSKRCADIDLGRWIVGGYVIESTSDDDEEDGVESEAGLGPETPSQ
jgi:uncharacterized protein